MQAVRALSSHLGTPLRGTRYSHIFNEASCISWPDPRPAARARYHVFSNVSAFALACQANQCGFRIRFGIGKGRESGSWDSQKPRERVYVRQEPRFDSMYGDPKPHTSAWSWQVLTHQHWGTLRRLIKVNNRHPGRESGSLVVIWQYTQEVVFAFLSKNPATGESRPFKDALDDNPVCETLYKQVNSGHIAGHIESSPQRQLRRLLRLRVGNSHITRRYPHF